MSAPAALASGCRARLGPWLAVTGEPLFWVGAAVFIAFFVITMVTTPRVLRSTTPMPAELDRRDAAHLTR